ncbi:MAG: insulinase family protein [Sulfurimonas sp.]|jgi:zinc protease|nr:insulinase family protein [Sulfurimonas sp.]MBU3939744.1 insulinase family protein [bacterium]MBU4024241.1 insulinase family protein [bacterium]MBU4058914.1 insulinase family protein [bacterium]MBU4110552.1 insulinase family protein [bacterium]
MKKIFYTFLILGQILMAAKIDFLETSGLKIPIIYEQDKRLPLVTLQFTFTNSGSITDVSKAGLAKFSAKIMNEGTKELGSSAFAEALEAKAIHISAHSGTETFIVELGCLSENFDEGLEHFDALLKSPNVSQESVDKVKTMTLGALSRKENDFDYIAGNELNALLFEGSVLAQPSSGTMESVKSIELKDVENFVRTNLVSSKLIVVLGGDIDLEVAKKKIAKVIDSMNKGSSSEVINVQASKEQKEKILKRDTEQAYVYFGSPYNMSADDEEQYKARVATFILGTGGFGSRLMEEVRVKRGLAYSAYARTNITKSSSSFNGYLQTKLDSLEEARTTVNSVIADFVRDGVTQDELEQTQKFLLGSEPLRVETMSQRLNRTFLEYYKGQELGFAAIELEKIKNLKLEDLNAFIKKHTEIVNLSYSIVTK